MAKPGRQTRRLRLANKPHDANLMRSRPIFILVCLLVCALLGLGGTAGYKALMHQHAYMLDPNNPRDMQIAERLDEAFELNNRGFQAFKQGDYQTAHDLLSKALEIKANVHGKRSVPYALTLINLADNYLARGQLDEAEAAGKEALSIHKQHRDPEARFAQELLDEVKQARREVEQQGKLKKRQRRRKAAAADSD